MEKINTFVVPHRNYEGLRTTLESIRRNTPPNFYIILVDQNETYQQVDDLVDLHLFTNGNHLGYAKSFNLGCRLADTKYVTVWNDDAECINKKWWDGVEETFKRYETAVAVNPASPRNPRAAGAEPINAEGWDYKPDYSDEEYDKLVKELGKGHVIDGICMFATVFDKEKLDQVAGVIPGKAWMDEHFWPGGGEDYDLNRRAYMTKNADNKLRGYRCLGTQLSYIWHHWYSTKRLDGKAEVKHCGHLWPDKWGMDADIYGRVGKQFVPHNTIREL